MSDISERHAQGAAIRANLREWSILVDTFQLPRAVRSRMTYTDMAQFMDYVWEVELHMGQPLTPKGRLLLGRLIGDVLLKRPTEEER